MGGAPSINPFSITFFPFFPIIIVTITTTLILIASAEDHNSKENGTIHSLRDDVDGVVASSPPPISSTDSSSGHVARKLVTFKPSTAVIVGVLTTTFSLALLLLLYAKHCNSGNVFAASNANLDGESRLHERKNSGIERTIVESLPVFKFESLTGQKHGLECAVCLNGFEDPEVLRLLPKCKHAFHMECVDTWLDEHSTCPLCRYKVDPNDIDLPLQQNAEEDQLSSSNIENGRVISNINDNASQQENENLGSQHVMENSGTSCKIELDSNQNSSSSNSRNIVMSQDVTGEHRLDHCIILSPACSYTSRIGVQQRWSNFESGDMLYLNSDRIISDNSSSQLNTLHGGRRTVVEHNRNLLDDEMENGFGGGGRGERNLRTVSERVGMSRFFSRERWREREHGSREEQARERERVTSRWLPWISGPKTH
jgi:E3 ubiquitin-protein ligase RNF38/44